MNERTKVFVHGNEVKTPITKKAIEFFCEELDIEPNTIDVYYFDIGTHNDASGTCYDLGHGSFSLIIQDEVSGRNITQVFLTLAHEMVHVKQYIKDGLSNRKETDLPYLERWYEKEAFEMQQHLLTGFVSMLENEKLAA